MEATNLTSLLSTFGPLVILFLIFYFFVIRPQSQQQKKHKAMLAALSKGDKVVTTGGLICDITNVEDDYLVVRLSDNSNAKIVKSYVAYKIENDKN